MSYVKLAGACAVLAVATVIACGVIYPLAVALVSTVAFPEGAVGSPVYYDGEAVGSRLIGQNFTGPEHFHSRPSAVGYDASASGASNLGPNNPALREIVERRVAGGLAVPDAVLASGSGLDPDISPGNALAQAPRVAKANGLDEDEVTALIRERTRGRFLIWGEPRVNVLELNLAIIEMKEANGKA